jgi:hypothetical protein
MRTVDYAAMKIPLTAIIIHCSPAYVLKVCLIFSMVLVLATKAHVSQLSESVNGHGHGDIVSGTSKSESHSIRTETVGDYISLSSCLAPLSR